MQCITKKFRRTQLRNLLRSRLGRCRLEWELESGFSDEFLEMTMCYETEKAEFETARNEAVDAYFAARPQIFRTREKECYVEAGFRMAWDFLKQNQKDENRSSSV